MSMGEGHMGEGTFGGTQSALKLKLIKYWHGLAWLAWVPNLPDVGGYQFLRNGNVVSRTFDPTRHSVTMAAQPGDKLEVHALMLVKVYAEEVYVA